MTPKYTHSLKLWNNFYFLPITARKKVIDSKLQSVPESAEVRDAKYEMRSMKCSEICGARREVQRGDVFIYLTKGG